MLYMYMRKNHRNTDAIHVSVLLHQLTSLHVNTHTYKDKYTDLLGLTVGIFSLQ